MSLNGGAWLDRAAWALRLELHIAPRAAAQEKSQKCEKNALTRFFAFQTNVIAELFGRFGSFIFGWLVPLSLVATLVAVLEHFTPPGPGCFAPVPSGGA